MKLKRIFSLALVLLMIVALVGCGGRKRKPIELTLNSEDATAILAAAGIQLPDAETAAGAGTTVRWFAHYDVFQNYSEDELVNSGAWTFKEKYGGSFVHDETTWENRWNDLANLLMSNDAPDLYPGTPEIFPANVMKKMFQCVDPYINYDDPLWAEMKPTVEHYFNLAGKNYAAVISNGYGTVLPYNRRVIVDEWGFEDPAELFYNDEWTWDKLYDMCLDFSDPDADRYAVDGWFFSEALMFSSGKTVVAYDPETSSFYSNVDDPGLERANQIMYDLGRNQCIYPRWTQPNWQTRNGGAEGAGVKDGLCLFWAVGSWGWDGAERTLESNSEDWGDFTKEEFMCVPMPRDPNGDGNYYIESIPNAYCIIYGSSNPEGAALVCACERFKSMDPVVKAIDRRQKKEKLLLTDEILDMYNTFEELANGEHPFVQYNDGMGAELMSVNDAFMDAGIIGTEVSSWAQIKEANGERLDYYIQEMNKKIQQFIETGEAVS